ncbi:MAG: acetate--CoA ligase [Methanomicrobia archaeon]|nr:acetate--CoA ligase [Methanomicrobia archaeon]
MKDVKWIEKDPERKDVFWPSQAMKKRAWVNDPGIYDKALKDPEKFWAERAKEGLDWFEDDFKKVFEWNPPYYKWFIGGKINASYNCLDRHIKTERKNKTALIWVPELPEEEARKLTYNDLYTEVNKFANGLKKLGVKKGDRVGIYLPMIPEALISMLACARIGAIHSVVFSAFSSDSLKARLIDAEAKVLITANGYYRRGKPLNLKKNADKAVEGTKVEKVVIVKRIENGVNVEMQQGRDIWWHDIIKGVDDYCEPEVMDSEDVLYILYTSGTTGNPKGIIHGTGGYLTQAYWTTKWDFDLHDDDIFFCTADVGWVTGHTYNCYGPFALGSTILVYEGAPNYPNPDRWWEIIEKYGVTVLYTAPTAIRMFIKFGDEWIEKHNLSSLRILGTVGEPIDRDSWYWYFDKIGGGRCPIIDTWWQTETGGTLVNSLPGIGPFMPGVAGRTLPGTRFAIYSEKGEEITEEKYSGYLVHLAPFAPGMLRGIWNDPEKYKETYWSKFGGKVYFTNDGSMTFDKELDVIKITGRVDDVMNVAGHRLSTTEVEGVLTEHKAVAEAAVVSAPHEIKGEVPVAFVVLKGGYDASEGIKKELLDLVRERIGPTAKPGDIFFGELPKTRSGKIMRRILRSLVHGQPVGDTATLLNPESVVDLEKKVKG